MLKLIPALLAALIHILFFFMESIWWMQPKIFRLFRFKTKEEAQLAKSLAFNQGFYNLFLAIGIFVGIVMTYTGHQEFGITLLVYNCAVMLAAAAVLVLSTGNLRGAIIQGLFPLLFLISVAL